MESKVDVEICTSLSEVAADEWNALTSVNDPFVQHAFLCTLESSGSVGKETGWQPCHILIRQEGHLVGATPLYLKDHSYGEYIFDWAWANGSERAGIPYYPKLLSAIPFTPVTGARLLGDAKWHPTLMKAAMQLAQQLQASSVHWLFTPTFASPHPKAMSRHSLQFHWHNPSSPQNPITRFDDWLSLFHQKDRKKVRAERRKAQASVDEIMHLTGPELTDEHIDFLWTAYVHTATKKWGQTYLSKAFFDALSQSLAPFVHVFFAKKQDRLVASSLCFQHGSHFYGRYWGALDDFDCLHFELCYHQPIEWCLQQGLMLFEAGAQGVHKLKRGLLPQPTYSWHWIAHPGLGNAIQDFLDEESQDVLNSIEHHRSHSPLKTAHNRSK